MKDTKILLPVVEIFASIQGEGFYSGTPATFIRFAGCDIGCTWCDSMSSWSVNSHPKFLPDEIIKKVEALNQKMIIITGGEPMLYNLDGLTKKLHDHNGFKLHLETSGIYMVSGEWDWICLSPKNHKPPLDDMVFQNANELKIIITANDDFEWAEQMREKVHENCKLYLQPEFSCSKTIIPEIFKYVLHNPCWHISLQLHKFMGIP